MNVTVTGRDELEQMKKQTAFMKANRKLIAEGIFYRLISPFADERNEAGWWFLLIKGRLWPPISECSSR